MTYFDAEETVFAIILSCCVLIGVGIGVFVSNERLERPNEKLKMCQAELPRNQKCILVAVPEEK